jgi:hypothetical protein
MKATLGITSTHSECDRNGAIIGVQSHRTSERASATATSFGCWVFAERRMTPPDSPVICNSGLQNWFRTRHAFRPRQGSRPGWLAFGSTQHLVAASPADDRRRCRTVPWSSPRNVILQMSRVAELGPVCRQTAFLRYSPRGGTSSAVTFATSEWRVFVLRITQFQP